MPRNIFSPSKRLVRIDENLPTVLCNAGYSLRQVFRGFILVDRWNVIVKEWDSVPSLTELFDLARILLDGERD